MDNNYIDGVERQKLTEGQGGRTGRSGVSKCVGEVKQLQLGRNLFTYAQKN